MNLLGHHCVGQTLADTASPRSLPVSTATNRTERAPHLTSPGGRAASPTMPSAGPPARTARSGPLGFGFPQRRTDFFFLIGLLKYYKARGSPPIPWWHSREPSTPSGTNTEQVSRSLKNRFKFPTREFSIRSFVLFFFFFSFL